MFSLHIHQLFLINLTPKLTLHPFIINDFFGTYQIYKKNSKLHSLRENIQILHKQRTTSFTVGHQK